MVSATRFFHYAYKSNLKASKFRDKDVTKLEIVINTANIKRIPSKIRPIFSPLMTRVKIRKRLNCSRASDVSSALLIIAQVNEEQIF